ncbi:MAG: seryl-tRNA synthetase [Gaiellales bacterium]|nr:seryl-tRNA synthetase [Gaiellales bacterium]MDX6597807.1 seryl-tRNA synthetase [Gaiellales bacterium]
MLDIRVIRSDTERVRAALARRQADGQLDEVLALDERRRSLQTQVDELRAERNNAAQAIGEAKRAGRDAAAEVAAAGELRDRLAQIEVTLREADADFGTAMLELPNLPHESAADGMLEQDATVHDMSSRPKPEFDFEPRDHVDLAGPMIDMERGARTSGSRFTYLLGDLVRLHVATVQYALDKLVAKGFTPVMPPVLVREEALVGTGFFPEAREQVYAVANADPELFLVGTSEVSLAALHMGEILPEQDLPLRYCGVSTCFRREAGTAGKDTRGIFRTHQFEKVEMFSFCHPDRSWEEHENLLSIEREIADELGLHYRVMNIAVGDLGAPAAKKYDIEAWLPGQGRYRELTSCSNTTDYQARRLDARYRGDQGVRHLHTLNGTAITSSRTLIAVLETHQESNGGVSIPEVLQGFGAPAEIRAQR